MNKIIKTDQHYKVVLTLIIPLLIVIFKPLSMTLSQSLVLATLFTTVTWWATGYINKEVASIFMIVMFILFGKTSIEKIFFFPLSPDFITIIAAFILSQGIVNSKVADRFSEFVLYKFCDNSKKLVMMSFILGVVFIFVIPQPFPRVIILASIFLSFLKKQVVDEEENNIILFSIFVASTTTCMMFLNGDVILNYAAINFAGVKMSQTEWIKYMLLPATVTSIVVLGLYLFTFRKNLNTKFELDKVANSEMAKEEKISIAIMLIVIVLWMTESVHGIPATYILIGGVAAMYIFKIVGLNDLKTINYKLLIFLTAAFAIGKVMTGSGVADILSNYLLTFFPASSSIFYIPFILILIVIVHMLFGSTITALSVLIPSLIGITSDVLEPQFIALLSYVAVSIQYLLPFHHVTVMIGFGNGYYENKHTLKIGLVLTIMLPILIFGVFIPWWKFIGVM